MKRNPVKRINLVFYNEKLIVYLNEQKYRSTQLTKENLWTNCMTIVYWLKRRNLDQNNFNWFFSKLIKFTRKVLVTL